MRLNSKTESEIKKLYGKSHVLISRLIGRRYNNPLGDRGFLALADYCDLNSKTNILDIGSGRSTGDILLAKKFGCNITGIELSPNMIKEAKANIAKEGLNKKIHLTNASFLDTSIDKKYDVIIALDSMCYFRNKHALFKKIRDSLQPHGIIMFSDYYASDINNKKVLELIKTWKICIAGDFNWYKKLLNKMNFKILLHKNTTKDYLSHWKRNLATTRKKRKDIINKFSTEEYESFIKSINVIIEAVNENIYGHMFCICRN